MIPPALHRPLPGVHVVGRGGSGRVVVRHGLGGLPGEVEAAGEPGMSVAESGALFLELELESWRFSMVELGSKEKR